MKASLVSVAPDPLLPQAVRSGNSRAQGPASVSDRGTLLRALLPGLCSGEAKLGRGAQGPRAQHRHRGQESGAGSRCARLPTFITVLHHPELQSWTDLILAMGAVRSPESPGAFKTRPKASIPMCVPCSRAEQPQRKGAVQQSCKDTG